MKRIALHDIGELKYKIGVVIIKLEYITIYYKERVWNNDGPACEIILGNC